jgi:NADPH:quinone reductase-like Zn-dependent oxidoreductase
VNVIDVYHRTGLYPRELPFIPGSKAAGTIDALWLVLEDRTIPKASSRST